jgi:hypothetical protein
MISYKLKSQSIILIATEIHIIIMIRREISFGTPKNYRFTLFELST